MSSRSIESGSYSPKEQVSKYVGKLLNGFGRRLFSIENKSESLANPEIPEGVSPTLYIHVPFCHEPLCEMCPFFKVPFKTEQAQVYVQDLRRELQQYQGRDFPSVYIGGGTPATVMPELLKLIQEFGIGTKELSIEAHPVDLTPQNIELMKSAGVTRLSVGIQSFDEGLLRQMRRNNGRTPVANLSRAQESFTVNADIIYNFAGQTIEQFEKDLDILMGLGMSQITCYPLMAAPGAFESVDNSKEEEFYKAMLRKFKGSGYTPLTPWCFTKESQGNQGEYISKPDGDQYVGVGASAISKIGSAFTIKSFDLAQYHSLVERGIYPVIGTKKLSTFEEAQYFLLTSLFGMKINLSKLTGNSFKDTLIRTEIKLLRAAGLVKCNGDLVELTESGMYFFSKAMKEFYTGLNFFRDTHKRRALRSYAALPLT